MDETRSSPVSVEVPNNQLSFVKSDHWASNNGAPTTGVNGEPLCFEIETELYEAKPLIATLNTVIDVDQVNASVSLRYVSRRALPTERGAYIEISRTEVPSHLCAHILRFEVKGLLGGETVFK